MSTGLTGAGPEVASHVHNHPEKIVKYAFILQVFLHKRSEFIFYKGKENFFDHSGPNVFYMIISQLSFKRRLPARGYWQEKCQTARGCRGIGRKACPPA